MRVCPCCVDAVAQYNWALTKAGYYRRSQFPRYLHQFIVRMHGFSIPNGHEIDHIDQDPANNGIENLRIVPHKINALNRRRVFKNNTSGFRGVTVRPDGAAQVSIRVDGKLHYLGRYRNITDAAVAYNNAALEHFGLDAVLNEV